MCLRVFKTNSKTRLLSLARSAQIHIAVNLINVDLITYVIDKTNKTNSRIHISEGGWVMFSCPLCWSCPQCWHSKHFRLMLLYLLLFKHQLCNLTPHAISFFSHFLCHLEFRLTVILSYHDAYVNPFSFSTFFSFFFSFFS